MLKVKSKGTWINFEEWKAERGGLSRGTKAEAAGLYTKDTSKEEQPLTDLWPQAVREVEEEESNQNIILIDDVE